MTGRRVTLGVVVNCRDDDELDAIIEAFADKGIDVDSADKVQGNQWMLRIPDFVPAAGLS